MYYDVTMRSFRETIFDVEKQKVLRLLSVCYEYVALFIQHTERMRRIILQSVTCLLLPYVSTSSKKKRRYFRKKKY
jgi:hypothetical protein